jgi:hypothetical protein
MQIPTAQTNKQASSFLQNWPVFLCFTMISFTVFCETLLHTVNKKASLRTLEKAGHYLINTNPFQSREA